MTKTTAECPDCGVEMRTANDGASRCPYCNSWAFRDAVSDGAIYAAASRTTARTPYPPGRVCPMCGHTVGRHDTMLYCHPECERNELARHHPARECETDV